MREAKTILSEVTVILNTQGNIEVEHNFVPVEDFVKVMNQKLPSYEKPLIPKDAEIAIIRAV